MRPSIVKHWDEVHPVIRAIFRRAHKLGFRVTSIVRPGSRSHATGRAIDLAPVMYSPTWASQHAAADAYRMFRIVSPNIMVVGEDDHIHIGVDPPFGVGYDGRRGRVLPKLPTAAERT